MIEKLQQNGIRSIYVGSANGIEKEIVKTQAINFRGILVGKIRNYFSFYNFIDPFKILIGIIQTFFIVCFYRPNAIFSKGGYVAFPILFWAKLFNIPTVAHESDSVLGRANVWAAKFAQKVCLGFPIEYYDFSKLDQKLINKMVYTGVPIRSIFFNLEKEKFDRPVILITGGSQGSTAINLVVDKIIDELLSKYEVFHLTGKLDFVKMKKIANEHYHVFTFTDRLPQMMANADLIVTRAGSTLAEISALGKASIVIPLPWASLDHQANNAKIYQENRATEVIPEKNLTPEILLSIINRLMNDGYYRHSLGEHAKIFTNPSSADEIANLLNEVKK